MESFLTNRGLANEEIINEPMVFLMQWSVQGKMILLSQHSRDQVLRFFTYALLLGKNFDV
jgi:hypothetical protein